MNSVRGGMLIDIWKAGYLKIWLCPARNPIFGRILSGMEAFILSKKVVLRKIDYAVQLLYDTGRDGPDSVSWPVS